MSEEQQEAPRRRQRRNLRVDVPEGTIEVQRTAYGDEEERTETVRVPAFLGPVGRVRVEGSVTRNMGDYNSVRVAVCVELPCYPEGEEIDRAYRHASELVDRYVSAEYEVATGQPIQPAQSAPVSGLVQP